MEEASLISKFPSLWEFNFHRFYKVCNSQLYDHVYTQYGHIRTPYNKGVWCMGQYGNTLILRNKSVKEQPQAQISVCTVTWQTFILYKRRAFLLSEHKPYRVALWDVTCYTFRENIYCCHPNRTVNKMRRRFSQSLFHIVSVVVFFFYMCMSICVYLRICAHNSKYRIPSKCGIDSNYSTPFISELRNILSSPIISLRHSVNGDFCGHSRFVLWHQNLTTFVSWTLGLLPNLNPAGGGGGVHLNSFQELALIFSWRVGLNLSGGGGGGGGFALIHSKSWP